MKYPKWRTHSEVHKFLQRALLKATPLHSYLIITLGYNTPAPKGNINGDPSYIAQGLASAMLENKMMSEIIRTAVKIADGAEASISRAEATLDEENAKVTIKMGAPPPEAEEKPKSNKLLDRLIKRK